MATDKTNYQKYYDEFMARWAGEYDDGDDACDDAAEFAWAKLGNATEDVENYGPNADNDDNFDEDEDC